MKNFFTIVAALIYIHSSVSAYYFNEEKNKLGYVLVDNGVKNHPRYAYQRNQRRQFAVSHHYSNENIVDSHFKTKTMPYHIQPQKAKSEPQEVQNTEVPKTQTAKDGNELKDRPEEKPASQQQEKKVEKEHQHNQQKSRTTETKIPKRSHSAMSPGVRHETKQSFLSMNINKAPISTNPQKYRRLNNNHPLTMSYHRQDYQRIPTSSLVDKNFQQLSAGTSNFQVMSRVLDDMTRNISDRRVRAEYRKRETEKMDEDKFKKNVINDHNMRKYLVNKDKYLNTERTMLRANEYARIGSREDFTDTDENPYAIFYRMHPDTLDDQTYISMMPTEPHKGSNKKKRLSMNYVNNTKKTMFNSSLKMHKKVKNFSNHRSSYD